MRGKTKSEFEGFLDISAQIGSDIELIQGAGGNTSFKFSPDRMAIKASGKLLADAVDNDIFVDVDPSMIARSVRGGDPSVPEAAVLTPSGLRPSIETTLHALMPHRVVIHTHSVRTIAHAIWDNSHEMFEQRLQGLNWASIPYSKPGPALTQLVLASLENRSVDVLVIFNHGLVVGADTPHDALALMTEVEKRMSVPWRDQRLSKPTKLAKAQDLPEGVAFLPSGLSHRLANCQDAISMVTKGSMYPDHVVFLGSGMGLAANMSDVAAQLNRCKTDALAPRSVVLPNVGIFHDGDLKSGAKAMIDAACLVGLSQTDGTGIRYLSSDQENELVNWEAEIYRQSLI